MARLRNRIRKADYFSDGELLHWPRDKRTTYSGLYALAEDSGCIEDDVFTWKVLLWPGPLDGDVTVDLLQAWRDELVAAGKLIPYTANGHRCLFLRSFHRHEHPRNPQPPQLPLPPWVRYEQVAVKRGSGDFVRNQYSVDEAAIPSAPDTAAEPSPYSAPNVTPVQSSPVQSRPKSFNSGAPVEKSVDDVDNSPTKPKGTGRKKKTLPAIPANVVPAIAKITGRASVHDLMQDGSDLNTQVRRLLALIDQLADDAFAHLTAEQRADRRDDARVLAFRRLAHAHQNGKPIDNLPAYLTTMLKNDWHLGDLVGDDFVEANRRTTRPKKPSEPKKLGSVLPPTVA